MAVSFAFTSAPIPLAQPNGVGTLLVVEGTLTVATTAAGDTAGDIPASLFKLQKIVGVLSLASTDDTKVFFASAASDGSLKCSSCEVSLGAGPNSCCARECEKIATGT